MICSLKFFRPNFHIYFYLLPVILFYKPELFNNIFHDRYLLTKTCIFAFHFKKIHMAVKNLFKEFPPVDPMDWEKKIAEDIKGADYEKKLIWKTHEHLNIRPYYTGKDIEGIYWLGKLPGEYPFARGNYSNGNPWEIRQDFRVTNPIQINTRALKALQKGVTSLGFIVKRCGESAAINYVGDMKDLLNDIHIENINFNLCVGEEGSRFSSILLDLIEERKFDPLIMNGSLDFDPLSILAITGNFVNSREKDLEEVAKLVKDWQASENFRTIGVNGYLFKNAGASVVEELACSLSAAVEYISFLIDKGLPVADITRKIQLNLGTGPAYFMEIAKLRAVRLLWSRIVEAFTGKKGVPSKVFIHSVTSDWNKAIYDAHTNMLRSTTEAMAAILGGTDSLNVKPYDFYFRHPSEFSERIALNTQLVLKEEAYFDKVADPAAGSYYLENLTLGIIEETWKLFLEAEEAGGFTAAFRKGILQKWIKETSAKRRAGIASRKETLLGINQFPNPEENVTDSIDFSIAFPVQPVAKTTIGEPVKLFRGAEDIEKLRLNTGKMKNGIPSVFLLTYGNPAMRTARANFASNFFGCAGFKIINNLGFTSIEKGIEAAIESKAEIVVICSADEEYPAITPGVCKNLKDKAIIVIAGYPKDSVELLKDAGIENFIHLRSNLLETLKGFQQKLGII